MIELKKIYLDENFEIVDGNRDYYIYFERVGHRFSKIDDIIHPDEKDCFLAYIKNPTEEKKILRFRNSSGEYRYNTVEVRDEVFHDKKLRCLNIIDVYDTFNAIEKMCKKEARMRAAMGLLGDTFFFYSKNTNVLSILHYHDGRCYVDFDMDIDVWKTQMLEEGYISTGFKHEFKKMVEAIKDCYSKIFVNLKGAFRTQGKIHENLNFIGSRFGAEDDVHVVGRIFPNTNIDTTQDTNNLIEELKFDPLTKCYNKKTITDYAIKKFSDPNSGESSAFVIVDLDHFKPVNDAYGHLAGDKVLEQAGELLRNIVGDGGVVGRYGGDEFVIVMNNVADEVTLRGILQTILVNVRTKFESFFDDIKVTSSIGAAVFPKDGNDFSELFKKADFCLYRAKDKGRDRYVFYRADLHERLYKKAIESTTGVKYQGRDVLELKYMSEFMQNLSDSPYSAIRDVLNHMRETYNLENITIYYGEDMKRIYTSGTKFDSLNEASYVNLPGFKITLDGKKFIRMDFPEDIKDSAVDFRDTISSLGIKSTLQCILGTAQDIKGLVAFNRMKESSQWAEYEVNCALMFASSFNLLPESVKVDFALFSRLKE